MKIKVGDIVVNILTGKEVGQYDEKYGVRILEEMITEKKVAEVMYVDDDGAVITKEFGPYAYPATALRLATEQEKSDFEKAKYTVTISVLGEPFTLPITVAKELINEKGITFGENNTDSSDSIIRYLNDNWNSYDDDKSIRAALLSEVIRVVIARDREDKGFYPFDNLVSRIISSGDKKAMKIFENEFLAYPISNKDIYSTIESCDYTIPKEYAVEIKKYNGYYGGALVEGTKLSDYLKANQRYSSYFRHYDKLTVDKEGINKLYQLGWGNSEIRRTAERLTMNMEMLKYFLVNPNRNFNVDMSRFFMNLEWKEIEENKELFNSELTSSYSLVGRLRKGKYIPAEYIVPVLESGSSCCEELFTSNIKGSKESLKLKDVVAFLETYEGSDSTSFRPSDGGIIQSGTLRADMVAAPQVMFSPF